MSIRYVLIGLLKSQNCNWWSWNEHWYFGSCNTWFAEI